MSGYSEDGSVRIASRGQTNKVTAFKDEGVKNCYEFKIEHEDHTLGNLVTQQLLTESNVLFAGYRIHHPLDDFIYMRVNVAESAEITNAKELVENSINTLTKDIQELTRQFERQLEQQKAAEGHRRGYGQ